jgi:hypothetical protein
MGRRKEECHYGNRPGNDESKPERTTQYPLGKFGETQKNNNHNSGS